MTLGTYRVEGSAPMRRALTKMRTRNLILAHEHTEPSETNLRRVLADIIRQRADDGDRIAADWTATQP